MGRSLNIAMFTETFVPHANGVTTSILNARRSLFERGHRVTVYSAGAPMFENESVHYYGGRTFPLYPDFPVAIFPSRIGRRNKKILARQNADLVHIHAPGPMGVRGYLASRRHRIPMVVTYHTVYEPLVQYAPLGLRTFYRVGSTGMDRLLNTRCTVLIAPTHASKRELVRKNRRWERKVRVVPTGVDLERFRPGLDASSLRQSWGFREGERVMLYLGRVSYEKRIDILLRAYARLHRTHPDLRFVVAGQGPALGQLKALANALGVADKVHFAGHIRDEDVPLCYTAADVFTSASDFETQGLTLIEAMACGTPSAAAGAGGFLDIVRDGDNGFLFPAGSVDGAVHGIEMALAAPAALRRRARDAAVHYGLENCARLLEQAYVEAIDRHA